jgi:hypothetical protein
LTVQVLVVVGGERVDASVSRADPGRQVTVSKVEVVLVPALVVDGDPEGEVPRLLVGGLDPLEPARHGVLLGEGVFERRNELLNWPVVDREDL